MQDAAPCHSRTHSSFKHASSYTQSGHDSSLSWNAAVVMVTPTPPFIFPPLFSMPRKTADSLNKFPALSSYEILRNYNFYMVVPLNSFLNKLFYNANISLIGPWN